MRYYCNSCGETISREVFEYSKAHFGRPLCIRHQRGRGEAPRSSKITPQARKLSEALKARGIRHKLEEYDGYKHVDISIPWAYLDIEIDGKQHLLNARQAYADLERSSYSEEDGIQTMHVPNDVVDRDVERLADTIAKVARRRYREQKEDEEDDSLS